MSRKARAALHASALLSALLASLAWPPLDAAELAWVAWTPWLAALAVLRPGTREAALSGGLHLAAAHLVNCWWFALVLARHGGLPLPAAVASTLLSALGPLPYGLVIGAAGGLLVRRGGAAGLFGLPFVWAAVDAVRVWVPVSVPWPLPALTQASRPEVLGVAELVGGRGLGALLLLGNVALVLAGAALAGALRGRGRAALAAAVAASLLVAAGLAWGRASARDHAPAAELLSSPRVLLHDEASVTRALEDIDRLESAPPPADARRLRVALVQGAAPQEVLLETDVEADLLRARRQLGLSALALAEGPGLIVWSESAHPATAARMPSLLRGLRGLLERTAPGTEAVVGVVIESLGRDGSRGYTNSVLLLDEHGPKDRYDKRWLVPFGEYVPAAGAFFWVRRLAGTVGGGFLAGGPARPLEADSGKLGASVCYEASFPQQQRALVRAGAQVLVNVTNDGWFVGSPAAEQHLRFSALRAVETRRWVVRCANSGVSAVLAPDGSLVARLEEGERGVLIAEVETRDGLTLHARTGDWPVIAAGLLAFAWALGGRRRREPGRGLDA